LEELIAPIPSPFVMTIAGSMAAAQLSPFFYLFVIALIAAAGKTIAAVILFIVADKAEDIVLNKIGRYIGVTHKQIEQFGKRFTGRPRDYVTLFIIRATPIIPSAPISLICGFINLPKRLFIVTTYLGTIVRDFIYLYIGYTGIEAATALTEGIESTSSLVTVILGLIGVGIFGVILYRKYRKPHQLDASAQVKKSDKPSKKS
jgi:membrane protein DedA with SNARE-associated domain